MQSASSPKENENFFFEKKKQKLLRPFGRGCGAGGSAPPEGAQKFLRAFFKKRFFLPLRPHAPPFRPTDKHRVSHRLGARNNTQAQNARRSTTPSALNAAITRPAVSIFSSTSDFENRLNGS
jgi:hypothetical protein